MPAWAWPCAVALVGGLLLAAVGARRPAGAWVLPTQEDEEVAAALASLPDGARVYVDLRHTGWALWVAWPRARVFFDARNDCHPAEVLRAGLDLGDGALAPDAALATLRRWGATHVVVRCAAPSRRALSSLRFEARGGVCVAAVAPEGLVGAGGGAHTRAP